METTKQSTFKFARPDLADRLAYIVAWQEEQSRCEAAEDERRVARARTFLALHRARLAQDLSR